MFGCCCGDSDDKVQANFQPMNERVPYVNYTGQEASETPDFKRMDQVAQDPKSQSQDPLPPPKENAGSGNNSQAGSKGPSRDRDKVEEKAKLQERVQSFAKRATKGIECFIGNRDTNEWQPVTYLLGKGLKEFIIRQLGRPDEAHAIADIMDIVRVEDDENIRSTSLAQTLAEEDQKRILVVQCSGKEIYMLEKDIEDAEIFFSSMRVLRLYCQQQGVSNN
mmetsp:Transcript_102616/g.162113  ORF Transcript_102616/g.162113 Transcript_102616/m.162113 type:complete len:221 (-) Transcript_102616:63-725(-)